jgi:dihydroorotase
MNRYVLTGAQVWLDGALQAADLLIEKGRIACIQVGLLEELRGRGEKLLRVDEFHLSEFLQGSSAHASNASEGPSNGTDLPVLDLKGLWILPGMVDTQVHFREPGFPSKEDLESGSRAAVAGGMTAFLEMPNTKPPTISAEAMADKVQRATNRCFCDFGFFIGAALENIDALSDLERTPGCCGVKIFMGSSTGTLLIPDDENLLRVLQNGRRRVAVHAEDEDLLNATRDRFPEADHPRWHPRMRPVESASKAVTRLIAAAQKAKRSVHVLHVNSRDEMELLAEFAGSLDISVEVTPQHLLLEAPQCYDEQGTFAQMNPPIRNAEHREALWEALQAGVIDCFGSDHAPHTSEEKARAFPTAPSGMPGTETMLPLMLNQVHEGSLRLEDLVRLLAENPARLYSLHDKGFLKEGSRADLTIVDPKETWIVEGAKQQSRCGWSAFEGQELTGRVTHTIVRGHFAYARGSFPSGGIGEALTYDDL